MKTHLNLLPSENLTLRKVKKATVVWLALLMIAGVGWIGVHQYQQKHVASGQLLVESLEREFSPVRSMQNEIVAINQLLVSLETKVVMRIDTTEIHPMLSLFAAIGDSVAATNGRIFIEKLTLDERQREVNGSPQINSNYQLSLIGKGTDTLAIARFSTEMRESGLFDSVELKSNEVVSKPVTARQYHLECKF